MVIPHLRVNYLTCKKGLSCNLEDQRHAHVWEGVSLLTVICCVITDHIGRWFKHSLKGEVYKSGSVKRREKLWHDLLVLLMRCCFRGSQNETVIYSFRRDSANRQLLEHKDILWSNAPLGRWPADLFFKGNVVFSLSWLKHIQTARGIIAYVPYLAL